ncbi:hypothetical protein ASPWEDRAFT_176825 [Aspergillus wentii DTO 134E9]|uniref:Uncharacterized protein n=1 Tax=Aspergillus wentii DTO 134E9 TaxID=1073089 RepID=A0A1L9R5G0_ASPWE|nr:uncharacterized protein ASPWEDRAFT_176825 [Aspergillus wentii DTO 134E9]KAI9925350.1 hypothetical protein MW887_006278 [Aspergillus wentii]OJJ30155.1 hypothetical protein ASPWEDRAFT_176825 [Aspergillus wentii DTO 134E9]
MDLLSDSSSLPPKGEADPFLVASSPGDRASVHHAFSQGQFEELRPAAYNKTWIISERFCRIGDSVDSFEPILHNLWYIYYQGGRYLSHESSEHDRLVLDVLRTRGRGPLTRLAPSGCGIDIARTPAGALWNDLPYLVADMTEFWVNDCATMEVAQRVNFASFLAKLASTSIDKDRLCQIALLVFRETFENDRRSLGSTNEPVDDNPGRTMHDLSIAALLPAACAWFREAGYNILLLSDACWNDTSPSIGQGGKAFIESELGQRAPAGFSPWRWMYWLKRLHEIVDEAGKEGDKDLAELGIDAIEIMLGHVEERNSRILRVFEGATDLQKDEHFVGLKKLLKDDSEE